MVHPDRLRDLAIVVQNLTRKLDTEQLIAERASKRATQRQTLVAYTRRALEEAQKRLIEYAGS